MTLGHRRLQTGSPTTVEASDPSTALVAFGTALGLARSGGAAWKVPNRKGDVREWERGCWCGGRELHCRVLIFLLLTSIGPCQIAKVETA